MANFAQGSVICNTGEPFRNLLIVTEGSVEAELGGHKFTFGVGDFLGFSAIIEGTHSLTYTATTEVTAFSYDFEDISSLETLLREKEDTKNVIVASMSRQLSMFLHEHASLKSEAFKAHDLVTKVYPLYEKLCGRYAYTAKKLPALAAVQPPTGDSVPDWAYNYYAGITELEPAVQKAFFSKQGISLGYIIGGSEEICRIIAACETYQKYIADISRVMLSPTRFDLFSILAELHVDSATIGGADAAVDTIMSPITTMLSSMRYVDQNAFKKRVEDYKNNLITARGGKRQPGGALTAGEKQNLADSMTIILKYSGYPEEQANKFARLVQEYVKLSDRASSDDGPHRMRRELTTMFNEVYKLTFMNSLNDPALPTIIKMFLNFGYMDANLAGHDNADYLYSIADSVTGDPERGIYTAQEWLTAVYQGKKDPCRNEFDMDYAAHVAELKQQKRFDAKEEARLLADNELKLIFEIDNIFPIVNKLTFGRITTFCPIFSDNNVQRGLEGSMITPEGIRQAFDEIKKVDFGAFYRETLYSNTEIGVPRETVHIEVMPEVILMPNVGVRGIMWQEIEGRKRTTPGRMFAPLFLLTDLKPLMTRLTGEFRWEMCKRVQGSRWQDITEASLTAEYCDYLQFYKSNRDLSTELKAQVKIELTRSRNNYKNVFVLNYVDWITHEANGSPRLNRVARKILMKYCTFASEIREGLSQNPQFAEALKLLNFKKNQREHLLSRVIQKLTVSKIPVPQELTDELEYVKS
ncbi:MAG: cyclic nucleotide-binding domain-containing protein [Defluviitaleaceae bacterium]|nr:cyclic nucleotide-binding domain-containing protein [Defluviitaleaceae bacterium]